MVTHPFALNAFHCITIENVADDSCERFSSLAYMIFVCICASFSLCDCFRLIGIMQLTLLYAYYKLIVL